MNVFSYVLTSLLIILVAGFILFCVFLIRSVIDKHRMPKLRKMKAGAPISAGQPVGIDESGYAVPTDMRGPVIVFAEPVGNVSNECDNDTTEVRLGAASLFSITVTKQDKDTGNPAGACDSE